MNTMSSCGCWIALALYLVMPGAASGQDSVTPRLWSNHGLWLAGYDRNVVAELGLTEKQRGMAVVAYGSTRREPLKNAVVQVDYFLNSLDNAQVERLNQITLQRFGVGALEMTEVAATLGLTDPQKQQIAAARAERYKKGVERLKASTLSPRQAEQLAMSRQARLADIVKELGLNDEQEQKLAAILERSDRDALQILGHARPAAGEDRANIEREAFEQALKSLNDEQRQQFEKLRGVPVKYRLR